MSKRRTPPRPTAKHPYHLSANRRLAELMVRIGKLEDQAKKMVWKMYPLGARVLVAGFGGKFGSEPPLEAQVVAHFPSMNDGIEIQYAESFGPEIELPGAVCGGVGGRPTYMLPFFRVYLPDDWKLRAEFHQSVGLLGVPKP